jgi:quercetin dioxygenase-like cupin family protein
MNASAAVSIVAMVLLHAGPVLTQDPVKVAPETYKVVFENATVRVLRVNQPAGGKTPMHQHPDNIVIPLGASKARFTMPDGKSQDAELASESGLYMAAGSHSGVNVGTGRVDVLIVEFKAAAPGKATLPSSRDNMAMKVLAEGPHAMAYRVTADPDFQEPAGSKHDYDQIVIALSPAKMSLSLDGKPARTTWARGDVQFIGRGTPHESKNTSGKPADFIIVAVK